MRSRPQRNRRRGILRAAGTVVVLLILLFIALLVVSSLSAPKAKAPVVPPTPAATAKPSRTTTPATVTPSKTATPARPRATATPRKSKKKALGLGPASPGSSLERAPTHGLIREALGVSKNPPAITGAASRSRNGRAVAYFPLRHDPYRQTSLFLRTAEGTFARVGQGDALVTPVLSADGRFLAWVRAQPSTVFPGTRWSVLQRDARTGRTTLLTMWYAMNVTPLGWNHSGLLTLVANSTDTALYALKPGHRTRLDVLMGQPLVTAYLSPDGRSIAFGAPTNCHYCTVDLYDIGQQHVFSGPTGMPNETTLAWTRDSNKLVALVNHRLTVIDRVSGQTTSVPAPTTLPTRWLHVMTASIFHGHVTLTDTVTGARFLSSG